MHDVTAEQVSASSQAAGGPAPAGLPQGAATGRAAPLGKNNDYSRRSLCLEGVSPGTSGTPKSASSSTPYRADIWRLQLLRGPRELAPGERVAKCLWAMVGPWVSGKYNDAKQRAHFSRLVVCGNVWACPVCSAVIAAKRADQVERALLYAENVEELRPIPITRTISHCREEKLADLLEGFRQARDGCLRNRSWKRLREEFEIQGSICALEMTWGERSGFHVHSHEILFVPLALSPSAIADLEAALLAQWKHEVERQGLRPVNHRGLQVGRAPASAEYLVKVAKAAARELTLSSNKRARGENLNPLELLEAYLAGDKRAGRIWQEYYACFHRRQQLVWSRGLLKRLLPDEDYVEDGDVASTEPVAREVVRLLPEMWSAVRRADARASVLRAIEAGEREGGEGAVVTVAALLGRLGVENAEEGLKAALGLPEPNWRDCEEERCDALNCD